MTSGVTRNSSTCKRWNVCVLRNPRHRHVAPLCHIVENYGEILSPWFKNKIWQKKRNRSSWSVAVLCLNSLVWPIYHCGWNVCWESITSISCSTHQHVQKRLGSWQTPTKADCFLIKQIRVRKSSLEGDVSSTKKNVDLNSATNCCNMGCTKGSIATWREISLVQPFRRAKKNGETLLKVYLSILILIFYVYF